MNGAITLFSLYALTFTFSSGPLFPSFTDHAFFIFPNRLYLYDLCPSFGILVTKINDIITYVDISRILILD